MCGIGVVTMIRFTLEAITEPGDRVMVFSPVYDPFFAVVKNTGRTLVDLPMEVSDGQYRVDLNAMEDALKGGVKALILCNPSQSGGQVWSRAELEAIAALCEKYHVHILSDEVHGDIVMEKLSLYAHGPAAQHSGPAGGLHRHQQDLQPGRTASVRHHHSDPALRARVEGALKGAWIMDPTLWRFPPWEAAYTNGDTWVDRRPPTFPAMPGMSHSTAPNTY